MRTLALTASAGAGRRGAIRLRTGAAALALMLGVIGWISSFPHDARAAAVTIQRQVPESGAGLTYISMLLMDNGSDSIAAQAFFMFNTLAYFFGQQFHLHGPTVTAGPAVKSSEEVAATAPIDGALYPLPAPSSSSSTVPCATVAGVVHPNQQFLYATSSGAAFGAVCAWRLDNDTRTRIPVPGSPFRAGVNTEAIAIDPSGTFLFATNEEDATVSAYSINSSTGVLTPITGSPFATGKSPRSVVVDATGRFVYVGNFSTNLSTGSISAFAIDQATGVLSPLAGSPFAAPVSVSGLAVEPTGRFLLAAGLTVQSFSIDATTGALGAIGSALTPFGTRIAVDPSGRFAYVTSNGLNIVTPYAIAANGTLTAISAGVPTGSNPIGVAVDPSGRFVYVANLLSDTVSGFAIDTASGALSTLPGFPMAVTHNPIGLAFAGTLPARAAAIQGVRFFYPVGISGGYPPYSWSVASGTLPPGLSLTALGAVQGTPTTTGQFSFTARAVDSRGSAATRALTFTVVPPSAASATIVTEFYNGTLDNFFITSNLQEAIAIDTGGSGPGWNRTGEFFRAGGASQVCRFYGSITPGPNSHFYTIDPNECAALKQLQQTTPATSKRWNFESLDFASNVSASGQCPQGTEPVYRAYNNGFARNVDSNHRFTRSRAAIDVAVAAGWIDEGVVMCAPSF